MNPSDVVSLRGEAAEGLMSTPRRRATAAVAAMLFLVVGYWLRPERPVTPVAEETAAPLLQQVVQQRTPSSVADVVQRVINTAFESTARITLPARPLQTWSDWEPPPEALPAVQYGVVVGAAEILIGGRGLGTGDEVSISFGGGSTATGHVIAVYPSRELALVGVGGTGSTLVVPPAAGIRPGDLLVALAPTEESPLAVPLFVAALTSDGLIANTPLDPFRGLPVFTERGELAGIVAQTPEGPRILPLAVATSAPVNPPAPRSLLGLSLRLNDVGQDMPAVTVSGLADGGRADQAGLRLGDVLVDTDGNPIGAIEAARTQLESDLAAGEVRVLRRGRLVVLRKRASA